MEKNFKKKLDMNDLVSIIVPIYKVEPYLRRCLDSIVNQTYTNLEIILVDDGSPDGCPQICDEYAAKDKRIVVIHKENGGLSDARNAGLDICKGEYVSFVDSDDWIAYSFVESLLQVINQSKAEIGVTSFIRTSNSFTAEIKPETKPNIEELNPQHSVKKLWSDEYIIFVTSWGKIYKKSLFSNIRFPKGKLHEDEYTTYKLLYKASKTIFLNIPLYFYFQRNDSIMANVSSDSLRILDALVERYHFFKKNSENEIVGLCLQSLCWDLLFAYSICKRHASLHGFSGKKILQLYKEAVSDYAKAPIVPQHLVFLKFFAFFPFAYILYRKLSPFKIRNK